MSRGLSGLRSLKESLVQTTSRKITGVATAFPEEVARDLKPFEEIPGPVNVPLIGTLYKYFPGGKQWKWFLGFNNIP